MHSTPTEYLFHLAAQNFVTLAWIVAALLMAGVGLRVLKRLALVLLALAFRAGDAAATGLAAKPKAALILLPLAAAGLWAWHRSPGDAEPPARAKQPKRQKALSLAERLIPPRPNAACPSCNEGFALTPELAEEPVKCGTCFAAYADGRALVAHHLHLQQPQGRYSLSIPPPPPTPSSDPGAAVLLTPLGKVKPPDPPRDDEDKVFHRPARRRARPTPNWQADPY